MEISNTHDTSNTTLGELIALFYDEYMNLCNDPELAAVATAASVNEVLEHQERAGSEQVPGGRRGLIRGEL